MLEFERDVFAGTNLTSVILADVALLERVLKSINHIEILPLLCACLHKACIELVLRFILFQVLHRDLFFFHVALCQQKHDRFVYFYRHNLFTPLLNIVERCLAIDSDTDHEDIGAFVQNLALVIQIVVSRGIMNLAMQVNRIFFANSDLLLSFVDIQDGWLVIFGKGVREEACNQTSFSYSSVSNKYHFHRPRTLCQL